ncbi:tetratricopeptide repeat protein [Lignipirellula cremea]|uniref:Tetratricopeptide repeat protein n=1 Tax=Lignipirellula cremea TaxID=2528010 RepID=A0A518E1I0_9BACT|nr:hypothetical protein [Lignipirellula cremea]QDU97923.1 Tetratricopeptide repeat protein [Lignipirellula cremea]
MEIEDIREPVIHRFYRQYLHDESSARFIVSVSRHYTTSSLERLSEMGSRISRRAGVLALSFLGDYGSNSVLGRALHDSDRGVRLLAENGIREVWRRSGDDSQRSELSIIMRLNASRQYEEAIVRSDLLIDEAPWIAEAWNQRAVARFHLGMFEDSANDCHQTLEVNPYHFPAAIGMAHCYLEMNDAIAALDNFRRALHLNPDLEGVRAQVEYLRRTLEER